MDKIINTEHYQDELKESGIYGIINLKNNKIYVGSTRKTFVKRLKQHYYYLVNNTHQNKYLQNSWNKNTPDDFEFKILYVFTKFECDDNKLAEQIEQTYLDLHESYNAEKGYNICPQAFRRDGQPQPPEKGDKIANIHNEKEYTVISPDGIETQVYNLKRFAESIGFTQKSLVAVALGKLKQYRGWQCYYNCPIKFAKVEKRKEEYEQIKAANKLKQRIRNRKSYIVIDPNGTQYTTDNLDKFAEDHNLVASTLYQIAINKKNFVSHRDGWKCEHADPILREKYKRTKLINYYQVITPTDEVLYLPKLTAFCREHGIEVASAYRLAYTWNQPKVKDVPKMWTTYGHKFRQFKVTQDLANWDEQINWLKQEEIRVNLEYQEYLEEAKQNRLPVTEDHIQKMRISRGWDSGYLLTSPTGQTYELDFISKEFCEEHGLYAGTLYQVARGEKGQHKQWKCQYADPTKVKIKEPRKIEFLSYVLTTLDDREIFVDNLPQYCKDNNLIPGNLYALKNGKIKSSKGYKMMRLATSEDIAQHELTQSTL